MKNILVISMLAFSISSFAQDFIILNAHDVDSILSNTKNVTIDELQDNIDSIDGVSIYQDNILIAPGTNVKVYFRHSGEEIDAAKRSGGDMGGG